MGALGKRWGMAAALACVLGALAGPAAADMVSAMVDISLHNDVDAVTRIAKSSGIELVMHRASLGAGTADGKFLAAFRKIKAARLSAGAYHVLYPQSSPTDLAHSGLVQAHGFLDAVAGACKAGEPVLLALDWESPSNAGLPIPPASAQTAVEFVSEVRSQTGAEVLIYTDGKTLGAVRPGIGQILAGSPLWYAAYHRLIRFETDPRQVKYAADDDSIDISIQRRRVDGLTFPVGADYAPWSAVTFWQFSEGGNDGLNPGWDGVKAIEPGISAFDTNYFLGTREAFRKFVAKTSWKCDPKIVKRWADEAATAAQPPAPPADAPPG
jgi:GH25 family lysozyme M1 (1,4-beta-N-acetylmuramidase)